MKKIKAPFGSLIVKAESVFNYYVKHGSITLYVDPLFKPGHRRVTSGVVYAVPAGVPDYIEIVPEVQISDKIYFHYNTLSEDSLIPGSDGLFVVPCFT